MSGLAAPFGLLLASPLALLALAVVPLIVILHALAQRRRRIEVSSLLFWDQALRESRALARLRRLLPTAALALQLLAAALLAAALAQPLLARAGLAGRGSVVLVLDETASMQSREGGRTRFEEARARARQLVSSLPRGRSMCIVAAGRFPRLVAPFTQDRALLARRLGGESATDEPGDIRDSLLFALGLRDARRGDSLVLITDGAFDSLGPLDQGAPWLHLILVGQSRRNAAVTALALRRTLGSEGGYELFVEVRSYSSAAMSFPLTVRAADAVVLSRQVSLEARGVKAVTAPYTGPLAADHGVRITAEIQSADDLPADDKAYAVLEPALRVSAAVVGPPNLFLDRALSALPGVAASRLPAAPADADVTVYDRVDPPALERGNFILLAAVPPNLPLRATGALRFPRVTAWQRSSPLLASVSAGALSVQEALRLEGRGFTPLVSSGDSPLVLSYQRPGLKVLLLAFPLERSDLPLRPAFPLLLANALGWFFPGWLSVQADQTGAGEPRELPVAPGSVGPIEVRGPAGERTVLSPEGTEAIFSATARAGFYTAAEGSRSLDFAVTPSSPGESDITPRYRAAEAPAAGGAERGTGASLTPLWSGLAAAALTLVLAELFLAVRSREVAGLSSRRRRTFLALRPAAVLLLVLALCGFAVPLGTAGVSLVFLLDQSASVAAEARVRAVQAFEGVRSRLSKGDTAVLVRFGASAEAEELAPGSPLSPEGGESVQPDATDIGGAIQFSLARLPAAGARRILLASDGEENRGRAVEAAALARSFGVSVYTLPLAGVRQGNDVVVEDIAAPDRVRAGEPFEATVLLRSRQRAGVRLTILRDGSPAGVQEGVLPPGESSLTVAGLFAGPGLHSFEAVADTPGDQVPENNRVKRFVEVAGGPSLLYVSRRGERSPALLAALRGQGISVEARDAPLLPGTIQGLVAYDGIILDDVPAYALSFEKMGLVERYVRDAGGGLLMLGGPNSYGAGGYYKTPIERALPVDMDVRAQVQLPRLSLVIVADKSGSMGAGAAPGESKLDVVKSAAYSAVELLNPFDRVGLLAFDADFEWTVPLTEAGERERIARELAALSPGGGTILLPALQEAHRVLAAAPSAVRHVIVISDGLSQPADFRREVAAMQRDRITVSTIAVGDDADAGLMQRIARWGGGRFYAANEAASVPRIFLTETMLVSRGLLMERRFLPRPVSVGELLRGVPLQGLPPLEGFVLTYLKNGAEMNLGAPFNSPLLATWRYGLGRAAAFTSDLTGRWGAAWLGWEGFPRFAAQLARWIQRPAPSDLLHPRVRLSSGTGGITVDAYDELGSFVDGLDLRADIQDPSGERREVPLRQSAPGMYAAEFPANAAGDYEVTLWEADRPELGVRTLAASLSYPEEFRDSGVNAGLLSAIARASGGTVLSLAEAGGGAWQELTRPDREPRTAGLPLWPYLLAAGLLAFFLDIAARRLVVPDRLASRLASLGRRTRGMGSGELAGMVAAARQREQEGRRLRERISATAAEGKIDPELAAYLYIARLKSQERERQEK